METIFPFQKLDWTLVGLWWGRRLFRVIDTDFVGLWIFRLRILGLCLCLRRRRCF